MTGPRSRRRRAAGSRSSILAVGAGKGGAGKSVVAANLGVLFARQGRRCALVDADLGGANLHTLLGIQSPKRTLSDFLRRKYKRLDEILFETHVPGLFLVSGAKALMEMANLKHAQKEKILRHIRSLNMDHVILDLGAGSSFNVIDFFLAADNGLMVVVPEPTSIENAYHFLKAAYFRKLKRATHLPGVRPALNRALDHTHGDAMRSAAGLLSAVRAIDSEAAATLLEETRSFSPLIVVNRVRSEPDHRLGLEMQVVCRDYFGSDMRFLGNLPDDDLVRSSVQSRLPAVEAFPTSSFAMTLKQLAGRLLEEDNDGG